MTDIFEIQTEVEELATLQNWSSSEAMAILEQRLYNFFHDCGMSMSGASAATYDALDVLYGKEK